MKNNNTKGKGKITHIMANGEVRDSLAGYLTNADQMPEPARRLLNDMFQGKHQKND